MRTDDLRRELYDLSSELEPFNGDPARIRSRVNRRRVAIAGALVVVLALPLAVATLHDGGNHVEVSSAKEVAIDDLAARDALVVVPLGGAADEVRALLESSDTVEAYTAVAPGVATMLEAPPSIEATCNDAGGFVVDLRDASPVSDLSAVLGNAGAVRPWAELGAIRDTRPDWVDGTLGLGRWDNGVELEVFMNVAATPEQIAAVRQHLESDTDVSSFEFMSKDDAYQEFQRIFADEPDLVASTTADALPTSFRVTPKPRADFAAIADRAQLDGVDEVLTPRPSPCS